MGKPAGKKKQHVSDGNSKQSKPADHSPQKVSDADMSVFIDISNQMKEEGNKLFQKRDYEGALLKYEKAVKLLPKSNTGIAYLRSNMAACYMQMVPGEFYRAIDECNLALVVLPKYTKALLKRAKCFETLNRLDLAFRDIEVVLGLEPNNLAALEIAERVKKGLEEKGIKMNDIPVVSPVEPVVIREKAKKKKKNSHKSEDRVVAKEDKHHDAEEEPQKVVKLVFGEDIRLAQLPAKCSVLQMRDVVRNKFPNLKALLVKYKDKEGDFVTITTSEELRWAEENADPQGSARLYIAEASPEQDLFFVEEKDSLQMQGRNLNRSSENGNSRYDDNKGSSYLDDWILQFAQLFKNRVGFSSDAYLDLHELGMKLFTEAIEETVTSEEAQDIFEVAKDKFQEMAALALFNWGNVHMSRARKRLTFQEDASKESIIEQVQAARSWAQEEYVKAGKRYEEALKIKPDFYEGYLALCQQQFEQAKLSWYFAVGSKLDLENSPSTEVLELFNNAEDNMERGTELWQEMEEKRLKELRIPNKEKMLLQEIGLDGLIKYLSPDEAAEVASNMKSQINILWGTMLYERSVIEFKLGLPTWEDCLMVGVEKFKLAGASPTDIAVMIKNHCANTTAQEGLSFKIDEIVQAWNEMYDAKRWMAGVPSFRLEPLFRHKVPELHHMLEHL